MSAERTSAKAPSAKAPSAKGMSAEAESTEPASAEPTRFTRLFGVQVDDPQKYAEYRARMTPVLHAHGGDFGIDLEVSRVLRAPNAAAMNRVFTIVFPDRAASSAFFANDSYRAIRAEWFEPAVSRVSTLAEWTA